jgi:hypothetical protein
VSYSPCERIQIVNNKVKGFPYAQGVLVHAGSWITISNNHFYQISMGVSVNPFNSTDFVNHVTITGNVVEATNASTLPASSGDVGIHVKSGGSTPLIFAPTITGNVVHGTNRVALDTGQGGYVIGFTSGATVTGNVAYGCGGNGFIISDAEPGITVTGNSVLNPVAISTTQIGFNFLGAPKGTLVGNTVSGATGTNGIGFKVATATNLKWKDSGSVLLNAATDSTTASA